MQSSGPLKKMAAWEDRLWSCSNKPCFDDDTKWIIACSDNTDTNSTLSHCSSYLKCFEQSHLLLLIMVENHILNKPQWSEIVLEVWTWLRDWSFPWQFSAVKGLSLSHLQQFKQSCFLSPFHSTRVTFFPSRSVFSAILLKQDHRFQWKYFNIILWFQKDSAQLRMVKKKTASAWTTLHTEKTLQEVQWQFS